MIKPSPFFLIYTSVEVESSHNDNLSPSPQVVDRFLERKQKMRTEAEGSEVKAPAALQARVLRSAKARVMQRLLSYTPTLTNLLLHAYSNTPTFSRLLLHTYSLTRLLLNAYSYTPTLTRLLLHTYRQQQRRRLPKKLLLMPRYQSYTPTLTRLP